MPCCIPSSYPGGRLPRITFRTSETASRRPGGNPAMYDSGVRALLSTMMATPSRLSFETDCRGEHASDKGQSFGSRLVHYLGRAKRGAGDALYLRSPSRA